MKISEAKRKTAKYWRTYDITWTEFCDRLRAPVRTPETLREYAAMAKEDRDRAKEASGGFVAGALRDGRRKSDCVVSRSMVTLDADNASPGVWDRVTSLFDEYALCCYTTHSHTDQHPRIRWIVPTDRAMTPEEYPAVARWVAQFLDIESMDPTTYEVARLMYWPTCSTDGPYVFHEQQGPFLSVDDVLAEYGDGQAWHDASLWPAGKCEVTVRARAAKRAGEPTEKPGMIGLFCRTFDVYDAIARFLPDVYTDAGSDRYTFVGGSTTGGAVVYQDGAFLYSNHSTDPTNGQSVNAFDLVRIHKYGDMDDVAGEDTPVTKLKSYKAMCEFCSQLPEIKAQLASERAAEALEQFGDLSGVDESDFILGRGGSSTCSSDGPNETIDGADDQVTGAGTEGGGDSGLVDTLEDDWTRRLMVFEKTGSLQNTITNAWLIISNDPLLKDSLCYDNFAACPKIVGPVPWPRHEKMDRLRGSRFTDGDEAALSQYLEERWKMDATNKISKALDLRWLERQFNPLERYLSGLKWDGVPRLETVFIDYFGADDNFYNRTVTRKWLTAAVARGLNPGCKFDNALILVGKQGLGKSTFADVLSKGWFTDSVVEIGAKDGYSILRGRWIIELAELASMRRADTEMVKNYISGRTDVYRPSYGKHDIEVGRQCVFFGTTNQQEFLHDGTGNRRFWPIHVKAAMNVDKLRANVDQIWAEAVVNYKRGEKLWLDTAAEARAWEAEVERYVEGDELADSIERFLDIPILDDWYTRDENFRRDFVQGNVPGAEPGTVRRDAVRINDILHEWLGKSDNRIQGSDYTAKNVRAIMNNHPGWVRDERQSRLGGIGSTKQFVYRRTEASKAAWTAAMEAEVQ